VELALYNKIFTESKTIAVVGLSSNPSRPSFGVSRYMQSVGYRIIPVNPNETEVLGEKAFSRLEDIPIAVDIVDLFRRPEAVPPLVEAAIRMKAKVVWMQEGIYHQEAAHHARQSGLMVVMDRCILKEHMSWVYAARHTSSIPSSNEAF